MKRSLLNLMYENHPMPPLLRRRIRSTPALAIALVLCSVHCGGGPGAPRDELSGEQLVALGPAGRAAGFNLLLITVDTLRADHLGCYGYDAGRTPSMDGLSRPGILFEHAIAAAPITLPSHSTMMTGLSVPSHGVHNNGTFRLAGEHRTLAEVLQEHGYDTAAFVGAYVLDSHYGLAQGFDTYDDDVNPRDVLVPEARYSERDANYVSDSALEWLAEAARRPAPFFAWLHFFDPHAPYRPPGPFAERFAESPYDGEIAFTDEQIGRIVAFLEDEGLRERTLVVLTADHGESLGEHDEATHALLIYDATVRVPLILSSPVLFPDRFHYRSGAVGLADLFPTLLHLLGLPLESPVDGRNLFAEPPDARRAVYVETLAPLVHHGWASLHGLRRAGTKLIRAPEMEFFDLSDDPGELRNLYAGRRHEAQELERELDDLLERWGSPLESLANAAPLDAEQLARLSTLGYVDVGRVPTMVTLADPKSMMPVWNRIKYAEHLCNQDRCAEAIEEIEGVLAEHETSATAWYTATRIYRSAGRIDQARAAIRHAVELNPSSEGFVTQAQLALMVRDEVDFERAVAQATALDPDNGRIYLAHGDRLAIRGDYREALVQFEKVLEVDPHRSGPIARKKIAELQIRLER